MSKELAVTIILISLVLIVSGCTQTGEITGKVIGGQGIMKLECPTYCDDGNDCTKDYCSEDTGFECRHEPIKPCCGNLDCESNENHSNCPIDCECVPDWNCSNWGECSDKGEQTRICEDSNSCGMLKDKPVVLRKCTFQAKIGDSIEKNGLKITLNSVRDAYHLGEYYSYLGKYQYEPKDGWKLLILSLRAENKGDEKKYVSPSYLLLIDDDKNQYEYASATYYLNNSFESKAMLPGIKSEGEIAFEVPINAEVVKVIYEIDSFNNIYCSWVLSSKDIITTEKEECGGYGQPCCDGKCSYGNECINSICVEKCGYKEILIDGICVSCGGTGEICCPVNECTYSFNVCKGGICVSCGDENEPCCDNNECNYGKTCISGTCFECGDKGQPCCDGNACFSYPTTTCIDGICEYCGRTGEICCDHNKCNVGKICRSGICEDCGGIGEQCCSPDNPYICFIGECVDNICIYVY